MATRWGIISAGKISSDFVAAMRVLPQKEHTVIGVAARNKERAHEFAKRHGIPLAYGSYEELLSNAEIEVVYVGVLNPQHLEVAKLCLQHGKHVLCEKPLCLNYREADELVKLAKEKKLFLMEAIWSRCFPVYEHLRKILQSKTIGDVLFVDASFGLNVGQAERLQKNALGGGTLLDMGVYTLQLASLVLGSEPMSVKASGHLNEEGVDKSMSCVLTYPSGATAVLSTHSKVRLPNNAVIIGTKGAIKMYAPFLAPSKITLTSNDYKVIEEKEFPLPKSSDSFNFENSVGLNYEAAEVRRCLKAGLKESPLLTHDESLKLAKLEDEIRSQLGVIYPQDALA